MEEAVILACRLLSSTSGFWLLASGFWLLASGFWLLASGFWLLKKKPRTTLMPCR